MAVFIIGDLHLSLGCKMCIRDRGYTSVKLYFMMGLPTETLEDIEGIAQTAQRVVELFYQNPNRPKGKSVQVSISVACFVPKPHTCLLYTSRCV